MLERATRDGLSFYRKTAWQDLRHGIFTRRGGVSVAPFESLNLGGSIGDASAAVKENHRRMYRALDVNPARARSCWLVHGVRTLVINGASEHNGLPDRLEQADAIITDQADLPLVMRYADCAPLLFYDPVRRAIGLGHAGWRGTVKGIASHIVDQMRASFGCQAGDIEALIGPAISRRNYPVGDEVVAAAQARFGDAADQVLDRGNGQAPQFDLWRANELELARLGVNKVEVMATCTYENTAEFYSHRAEQGSTGRFGVAVSL